MNEHKRFGKISVSLDLVIIAVGDSIRTTFKISSQRKVSDFEFVFPNIKFFELNLNIL